MGKKFDEKSIKVIGKNCRWNYRPKDWQTGRYDRYYYCTNTNKRCGLDETCNCFDDKGNLRFERKDA